MVSRAVVRRHSCGANRSVAAVAGCERGPSRSLRSHPVDLVRDRSVRDGNVAWPSDAEVASDAYEALFPSLSGGHARRRSAAVAAAEPGSCLAPPTLADGGLAASVVAALTALAILQFIRSTQFAQPVVTVVETASGENRDVPLGDGSIVSAGAQSVLWATLSRRCARSHSRARRSFLSRREGSGAAVHRSRSAPRPSPPWVQLSTYGARASASSSAWPRGS